MGIRFNKRIKIRKHTTLNLGKKGASVSAKAKNVTFNSKGRVSVNIPGTGITFYKDLFKKKK